MLWKITTTIIKKAEWESLFWNWIIFQEASLWSRSMEIHPELLEQTIVVSPHSRFKRFTVTKLTRSFNIDTSLEQLQRWSQRWAVAVHQESGETSPSESVGLLLSQLPLNRLYFSVCMEYKQIHINIYKLQGFARTRTQQKPPSSAFGTVFNIYWHKNDAKLVFVAVKLIGLGLHEARQN